MREGGREKRKQRRWRWKPAQKPYLRSAPSLTPFLTPWLLLLLLLPYHQFPSCQFSSGEKRGEERERARAARYHFPPAFPDVDRLGLLAVSNEMVVIQRNERRAAAAAEEGVIYGREERAELRKR